MEKSPEECSSASLSKQMTCQPLLAQLSSHQPLCCFQNVAASEPLLLVPGGAPLLLVPGGLALQIAPWGPRSPPISAQMSLLNPPCPHFVSPSSHGLYVHLSVSSLSLSP